MYEGLFAMSIRDLKRSANLFYLVTCVRYTVFISLYALDRSNLHKRIIKASEIPEDMDQIPKVNKYLFHLSNCQDAEFFQCLGGDEQELEEDGYIAPQSAPYVVVREMKIKAFAPLLLLESYRSLTLKYMANAFGVRQDYMDSLLNRVKKLSKVLTI